MYGIFVGAVIFFKIFSPKDFLCIHMFSSWLRGMGIFLVKKSEKKVRKKFGGKEKVRIFAVPFGNGGDGERRTGFPGRRERSLTRLRKYKNNKVPRTGKRLTRALIPSRNEQQSGSLREI